MYRYNKDRKEKCYQETTRQCYTKQHKQEAYCLQFKHISHTLSVYHGEHGKYCSGTHLLHLKELAFHSIRSDFVHEKKSKLKGRVIKFHV